MTLSKDEYKGSNFVHVGRGITLGCITPEARELLDTIVEAHKKHYDSMIEKVLECETPDDAYGAFYWLVRWSGLVQLANNTPEDEEECLDNGDVGIGHPLYWSAKEEALVIGKILKNSDFVETLALIFESTHEISGGRAAELMQMVTHLLTCRKVCMQHGLMGEVRKEETQGIT